MGIVNTADFTSQKCKKLKLNISYLCSNIVT